MEFNGYNRKVEQITKIHWPILSKDKLLNKELPKHSKCIYTNAKALGNLIVKI